MRTHEQRPPLLPVIQGLLPTLKRAQRRIAKALLDDPEQFITHSISDLAENSGASTGSIVMFCKQMGFKGFPAFKISLARELAAPVLPSFNKKASDEPPSVLERVFEEHIASLRGTMRLNSPEDLIAAAKSLGNARRIVLFSIGLSYPVAYSLYARLRFIGLPAFVEYDSHLQLAAAAEMTRGEVAVGISVAGSTSETVECLRLSRDCGARTICITNAIGSPLAQSADIRLYAAPSEVRYFQAPLASRVGQLALADALLVLLVRERKRKALAHLERAEEHLLKRRMATPERTARKRTRQRTAPRQAGMEIAERA
jgi:RpiR family carbohydrate utilization transcriptional regulator